jgi:glutamate:GABA antiporter
MATEKLKRALGIRDVFLFYIVSSLSLRWIATAAAAGQSAITVWVLGFCGFFLPLAGCVLELSSRYPQEGGLYIWTREAYGDFAGFMAAWTYWMSNLPYFGAVLYFAASSLLFATPRGAHLADTNSYFLIFTASALTIITVLNVVGLGVGKWLNNLGAVGMALPVLTLIALGVVSFSRFGSATHFSWSGFIPRVQVRDLIFWSTIFFAFSGCECASFMGDEIKNARRVLPRALVVAGAIITIGYIAGTFAMLVALPSSSISGLGGFMTAIDFLCRRLGLGALVAPIAILVGVSNVGAAAAYLSSTARLPFVVGINHYCQWFLAVSTRAGRLPMSL